MRQFTRFGSTCSVFAAAAGSYAPIALLGAAGLAHAEVCLHVAAAYGLDPAARGRAVELLVLGRVHPNEREAQAALASATEVTYESTGLTDAAWRLGRLLVAQGGSWAAVRLVNRVLPGASVLAAALSGRAAVQASAARAKEFYGRRGGETG